MASVRCAADAGNGGQRKGSNRNANWLLEQQWEQHSERVLQNSEFYILQQEDMNEDSAEEDEFGHKEPEYWPFIQG